MSLLLKGVAKTKHTIFTLPLLHTTHVAGNKCTGIKEMSQLRIVITVAWEDNKNRTFKRLQMKLHRFSSVLMVLVTD